MSASCTLSAGGPLLTQINLEAMGPPGMLKGSETGQTTFSLFKTDPMFSKQPSTALSLPQGSASREIARKGTPTKSYLRGPLGYVGACGSKQKAIKQGPV